MSQRSTAAPARPLRTDASSDVPPPDVIEFIRFCHRRRHARWPELYDDMCAVAARREFHGWGHEQLEARGLTLSLFEMPRLAGWVRAVVAASAEPRDERAGLSGLPASA